MERKRLVFVLFLWLLPLGLNSTVIPQPNSHSTDFRSSEVTATSDKVSPLEMAQEHLNNAPDEGNHSTIAPSGELKFTVKGPTGPSELPSAATSPTTLPPSIGMTKSLTHISTPWTSTQSAKTLATPAASVTASIAVTSTKGQSPLMVPTAKHVAAATTTKNKPKPPPSKMSNKDKNKTTGNHGTVVAVLIGVTLVLMLVSFGVIFVTKRRHQRMQLQNTAWAGPSPFLDSGVQSRLDNDNSSDVHLRGSNRISFSGFLSQQLSKRLSLLQETDEEFRMGEIPTGSTFGRETVSDDVQLSNGAAAVHKEKTQAEEVQPLDNSSSPPPPTSSETTATAHTHDHQPPTSLQVVDLGPDNAPNRSPSRTPPDIPEAIPPPLLDVYLGPPSDQASPPPPESTDLPTPPPDLP
uniref:Oligodendrocyte-myelin glycoprotein-like n=1 Tax=Salmo trutta TaxID=8032 RepID=A0A673XPG8_SALTR